MIDFYRNKRLHVNRATSCRRVIGILVVGVVAYNGYTKAAKINVVKSNVATIKKFIQAEVMKCVMRNTNSFNGELNCSNYIADDVAGTTMNILASDYKNPFDPQKDQRDGIYTAFFGNSLSDPCNSSDRGRISIRQNNDPNIIIIEGCADTNSEIIRTTFSIETN